MGSTPIIRSSINEPRSYRFLALFFIILYFSPAKVTRFDTGKNWYFHKIGDRNPHCSVSQNIILLQNYCKPHHFLGVKQFLIGVLSSFSVRCKTVFHLEGHDRINGIGIVLTRDGASVPMPDEENL